MSTKTLRKRIALVAVSAVSFGLLSSVAANATVAGADTIWVATTASTTGSAVLSASGGAVGTDSSVGFVAATTAGTVNNNGQYVSAGGSGIATVLSNAQLAIEATSGSSNDLALVATGGTFASGAKTSGPIQYSSDLSTIASSGTGTSIAASVSPSSGVTQFQVAAYEGTGVALTTPTNGTLIGRWIFNVVAAGTGNTISVSKSVLAVDTSSSFANTVDQAAGFTVANGSSGYIAFVPKDAYGVTLTGSAHAFQVSATGGALVGFNNNPYPTTSSAVYTTVPTGIYVNQPVANVGLSTVVTVTVDGTVVGSKSITFLGDLAKIVATPLGIAQKGSVAFVNELVTYKAYDAAGNRLNLPGSSISIKGTDAVINTGTVETGTTTSVTGVVGYNAATYGTNTTLYLSATNNAGATISSNVFSLSSAGDAYTYTAKLDKSVYHMGDIATLTISTYDSKGNAADDITPLGTNTYKPSIAGNYLTAVSAPLYTDLTTNGVITYQFIVGNTAGTYSMAVDLPLLTNPAANATDTPKTIGYSIASDGSVSNADVLSAIVKLIASINKQIAALQKSLKK